MTASTAIFGYVDVRRRMEFVAYAGGHPPSGSAGRGSMGRLSPRSACSSSFYRGLSANLKYARRGGFQRHYDYQE